MSDFKWKQSGIEIPLGKASPETIKRFEEFKRASDSHTGRWARFVLGVQTEEDKKWLEEQSSYCHECGRSYVEAE